VTGAEVGVGADLGAGLLAIRLAQEGQAGAGPLALLIIVLLGIATVLLVRNMNTRIRRLPRSFEDKRDENGGAPPPQVPPQR
jgi:hypothetical protein